MLWYAIVCKGMVWNGMEWYGMVLYGPIYCCTFYFSQKISEFFATIFKWRTEGNIWQGVRSCDDFSLTVSTKFWIQIVKWKFTSKQEHQRCIDPYRPDASNNTILLGNHDSIDRVCSSHELRLNECKKLLLDASSSTNWVMGGGGFHKMHLINRSSFD